MPAPGGEEVAGGEAGTQAGMEVPGEPGQPGGAMPTPGTPEMASVKDKRSPINEALRATKKEYQALAEHWIARRRAKVVAQKRVSAFEYHLSRGEMKGMKIHVGTGEKPKTLVETLKLIHKNQKTINEGEVNEAVQTEIKRLTLVG